MSLQDFQKLRRRLAGIMAVAMVISNLQCPWPIISYAAADRGAVATGSNAVVEDETTKATSSDAGIGDQCICTGLCSEDDVNENCPVCKEDYSDCLFAQDGEITNDLATSSDAKKKVITDWTWNDPDEYLSEGVLMINPTQEQQASFDDVVALLPESITAEVKQGDEESEDTVKIEGWKCDEFVQDADGNWPYETGEFIFEAVISEEYGLSEDTKMVEVKVQIDSINNLYVEIFYYVTYDANGGESTRTDNRVRMSQYGDYLDMTSFSKEGCKFEGWCDNPEGTGTIYKSTYKPTKNTTLYAKYTEAWTITYDANGGTLTNISDSYKKSIVVKGDDVRLVSSGYEKEGATFVGWCDNREGTGEIYNKGSYYTPTDNITLYAKYVVYYTVTYDVNGGTLTSNSDYYKFATVEQGKSVYLHSSGYEKEGAIFAGWYDNPEGKGDVYSGIYYPEGNITLYAKWSEYWTITYDVNNGNLDYNSDSYKSVKVAKGEEVRLNSSGYSKEGYLFEGWCEKADGTGTIYTGNYTPKGNITLYAKYSEYWTVTYDVNGGELNSTYEQYKFAKVVKGKSVSLPGSYPYSNNKKVFGGWCEDSKGNGTVYTGQYTPEGNITLYVKWSEFYIITYDANGGTCEETDNTQRVEKGKSCYLKTSGFSNGEKLLAGWSREKNGEIINNSQTFDSDVTLFAVWKDKFIVTYDANGGVFTGYGNQTSEVIPGENCYLNGYYYKKDQSVLLGWSEKADASTRIYKEGEYYCPTGNVTLYAVWKDFWRITFEPNGGKFSNGQKTVNLAQGERVDLSNYSPKKDGAEFAGWYTDEACEGIVIDRYYRPTDNVTLYAKWSEYWTISLDTNGGVIETYYGKEVHVAKGNRIYLYPYNATRDGDILIGWCKDATGTGVVHTGYYTPTGDTTFYAIWKKKGYTITLDPGIGTLYTKTIDVAEGEPIGYISDPTAESAAFDGWYLADGTTKINSGYIPTKDETIYAKWLTDYHTVTWHLDGPYIYNNGGQYLSSLKEYVKDLDTVYGPNVNRKGYDVEWYLDPEYTRPFSTDSWIESDLDLYGKWMKEVVLTWDADGGSDNSGNLHGYRQMYEGNLIWMPSVKKYGYTLEGWFTADGTQVSDLDYIYEDTYIKARWKQGETYKVTLDVNGGMLSKREEVATVYQIPVGTYGPNVYNPHREGYAFTGWTDESGNKISRLRSWKPQKDTVVKANWTADFVKVTFVDHEHLIHDYYNWTDSGELTINVPRNAALPQDDSSLYIYLRENDEFVAWALDESGTNRIDPYNHIFTTDTKVYAYCTEAWNVALVLMGGRYSNSYTATSMGVRVAKGLQMTYPMASYMGKEGYTFDAWYTLPNGQGTRYIVPFTPDRNMTLYANWIKGNVTLYDVTFETSGGSTVTAQRVEKGTAAARPENPTKLGWSFAGWYQDEACSKVYDFAALILKDTTVYAKWVETQDLKDAFITVNGTYAYTGNPITPDITVKMGDVVLKEDQDYKLECTNNINAGTASLTITALGSYEGTKTAEFEIQKSELDAALPSGTFTGIYGQTLESVMGNLGDWKWVDSTKVLDDTGTIKAEIVHPVPASDTNHTEQKGVIDIEVVAASINSGVLTISKDQQIYDGSEKTPDVIVKLGVLTLVYEQDYSVAYSNNVNAGTQAVVTVTGKNHYQGSLTGIFTIAQGEDPLGSVEVFNNIKYIYGETLGSGTIPDGWEWQHPDTKVGDAGITHNYLADFHSTNPNYKDKTGISIRVQVEPKDLKDSMVEMDGTTKIYTGSPFKPEVTVTDGEKLVDGKDYEVTYSNNTNVGTAKVSIEGVGNYTGTVVRSFSIIDDPYSIKNANITLIPSTYVYDGNEKTPAAAVSLVNKTLEVGTDYEISYKDNVNVGKATATITGKGEYHDAQDVNFAITKAKPKPPVPQGQKLSAVYGQKLSEIALKAGWTWQDAAREVGDVGTHTFLADFVSSDPNYADQTDVELQVEVSQKSILDNDVTITVAKDNLVYDGNAIEPEITITYRDKTLVKDTDFTVTYSDNMNAGKAKVVVTGIGNYTGSKDLDFNIGQAQSEVKVKTTEMEVTTKDEPFYLNATFKGDGDVTYTVEGEGVISVRKETEDEQHKNDAEVTVLGKGEATIHIELKETTNYKGAKMDVHVTVVPVKIGSGDVRLTEKEFTYSGSAFTPEPIAKVNGTDLTKGTDYTVAYNKNTDAGTAEVIVSGINDYTGSVTKTFTILKAEDTSEAAKTPTGLTATYGQKLEAIALPERWTWVTPGQSVGTVGVQTAKANYEAADTNHIGKENVEVEITVSAKAITAGMVTVDKDNLVYTGAEVKAPVTVQDGDQTLIPDTDYVASYSNAAEAGTASVKIEGVGNYTGAVEDTYQIAKADAQIQCAEEFTVKTKDEPFNLNAQFTGDGDISYTSEDTSVVTVDANGLVTVLGHGKTFINLEMKEGKNYKGTTLKVQVTVEQISLTEAGVAVADEERIFNGSVYTPVPVVVLNQILLTEGTDYTVSYEGNVHAGTAKVIVTGINDYKDTAETTFVIGQAEDTSAAASTPVDIHMVYGQKLADVALPAGWAWADSSQVSGNVGTSQYEAVYTPADSDYAEKRAVVTVTIAAKELTSDLFAFDTEGYAYTGNDVKPEVQLKDDAMTTDDFTIVYENCVEAGTATAVITGQKNYTGTVNVSYTILKAKPEITVKAGYFISKYTTDDAFALEATASNAAPLTYTSSNEKVAEVDGSGVVTLKGEGTAVILIKSEEQKNYVSAVKTVTVIVVKKEKPQEPENPDDPQKPGEPVNPDDSQKPGEPVNPDQPQKPQGSQESDDGDSDYITPGTGTSGKGSAAGGANRKNYIPQGYVGATKVIEGSTVPAYVEKGTWTKSQTGTWSFTKEDGTQCKGQWAAVYNAVTGFEWYHFDTTGTMQTGLITDVDGSKYYLEPSSGKMMIGWVKIDGLYYYFSEVSDGKRGRRLEDTRTPDGYYVKPDGSWDGKEKTEA